MAEERRETIKYRRIRSELQSDIQSGRWKVGERIPSEPELADTYDVSRGTVRTAIEYLVRDGMLRKEQGRGTFVISTVPRLHKNLDWLASFTTQLHGDGIRPSTEVLETGLVPAGKAGDWVAKGLRVPATSKVVFIRRLRRGDGVPFAIQTVYLLPDRCPGILDEGVDLTRLFHLYAERYGVHISFANEFIRVATASDEEAALLEIAPGDPVVIRERVSADENRYPFEILHSVDRGDRFEYRYEISGDSTRMVK